MGAVSEKMKNLTGNRLDLITEAESISGIVSSNPSDTIAQTFAQKQEDQKQAEAFYKGAESSKRNTSRQGYLKDAINSMKSADEKYQSLATSLPELEASANNVVIAKQTEAAGAIAAAQSLVSSTPTTTAVRNKVAEAKADFSRGQNTTNPGEKYANFAAAATAAREAVTMHNTQSLNASITTQAMKAELQDMIDDANDDEISTISQQKLLDSVKDEDYDWAMDEIRKAESELEGNAKSQYGWLEQKRVELIEKISLAGADDADLLTEMQNAERGVVDANGNFDYRKGIGHFKDIAAAYASVESTLSGDVKSIVSHSITTDTKALVGSVSLDVPSDITINVLVINTNEYAAQDVLVKANLPMPVPLLYSDITEGSDLVSSVIMNGDDAATIYLKRVEPYDRRSITFETSDTLAHTTKSVKKATGLGDGSASVSEDIDFTLDTEINALSVPLEMKNVKIDGNPPGRPLSKGKHHLSSAYTVADAYNESVANLKTSPLGLNSQVDYDIVLKPGMDLDSVTVFIDPGTKFSNINVFTLSGESVGKQKKITDWRYSYEVSGLTAGREASLRVSYTLENSREYISQELAAISTANYSDRVSTLVEAARAAFNSEDMNTALANLQQAKAEMKKEDAEREKIAAKTASLKQDVQAELDEINAALADAPASNSSLVAKLSARAAELDKRLSGVAGARPADALRELEAVDLNWKDNEIKSFRKSSFDSYNKLKLRFVSAGNTSTPEEFLNVESGLNKLEVSGRLEYAMSLLREMDRAESLVKAQEGIASVARAELGSSFETLRDSIRQDLKAYTAEANAAKGTEFSPLFSVTEKDVESKISELEKLVANGEPELARKKLDSLDKTGQGISGTLGLLRTQSANKIDFVQNLFNETQGSMSQADRDAAVQEIESMKNFAASGQYVNSLRLGNKTIDDINAAKKGGGNSLLLLGITAIAVLAVLSAYILKQQEGKKPDGGKVLKKLEKLDEGQHEKEPERPGNRTAPGGDGGRPIEEGL